MSANGTKRSLSATSCLFTPQSHYPDCRHSECTPFLISPFCSPFVSIFNAFTFEPWFEYVFAVIDGEIVCSPNISCYSQRHVCCSFLSPLPQLPFRSIFKPQSRFFSPFYCLLFCFTYWSNCLFSPWPVACMSNMLNTPLFLYQLPSLPPPCKHPSLSVVLQLSLPRLRQTCWQKQKGFVNVLLHTPTHAKLKNSRVKSQLTYNTQSKINA